MATRQQIESEVRQQIQQENQNYSIRANWTSEYERAVDKIGKAVYNLCILALMLYPAILFGLYGENSASEYFTNFFWILLPIIAACIYLLVHRVKALKKVPFKYLWDQERHNTDLEREKNKENKIDVEEQHLAYARSLNHSPFDRAEGFYVNGIKATTRVKNDMEISDDLDWLLKVLEHKDAQLEFLNELLIMINNGRVQTDAIMAYKKIIQNKYSALNN